MKTFIEFNNKTKEFNISYDDIIIYFKIKIKNKMINVNKDDINIRLIDKKTQKYVTKISEGMTYLIDIKTELEILKNENQKLNTQNEKFKKYGKLFIDKYYIPLAKLASEFIYNQSSDRKYDISTDNLTHNYNIEYGIKESNKIMLGFSDKNQTFFQDPDKEFNEIINQIYNVDEYFESISENEYDSS